MTTPPRARRKSGPELATMSLAGLALACLLTIPSPGAIAATNKRNAHSIPLVPAYAARTVRATDEARLLYIRNRSSGANLFEEGPAHGTLPGSVRAECNLGPPFVANVTISTRAGIIRGHGTATPHASGIYESFSGTLTITGGTGRYAHAHGHAGLYGVFNRRTYNLVVQTTGMLILAH
jgi:hypothetical protein